MTVQDKAGGRTEWVRGANHALSLAVAGLGEQGYRCYPLKGWLRAALRLRMDRLHDWAAVQLPEEEGLRIPGGPGEERCVTPSTVVRHWTSIRSRGCLNTSNAGMQVEEPSTGSRRLNRRGRLPRALRGRCGRAGQLACQLGAGHVALQEQQAAEDVHERAST